MLEYFHEQEMNRNAKLRQLYDRAAVSGDVGDRQKLRHSLLCAIMQSENIISDTRKLMRDPCDCEDEIAEAVGAVKSEIPQSTEFEELVDEAVLLGVKVPEF